jgi:predicted DNA-binding transcriptional regulator AlpA
MKGGQRMPSLDGRGQSRYLKFQESYTELGISSATAYRMHRSGTYPVKVWRIGRMLRVLKDDQAAFVAGNTEAAS